MRQERRLYGPGMDRRIPAGHLPRVPHAAARAARQSQRRHFVARRIRGHRGIRLRTRIRIQTPHQGQAAGRTAAGRIVRTVLAAGTDLENPDAVQYSRQLLPHVHDGGSPRTRQLLRRIVPQRPFPRSRPERLAAVAVPDRGIRLRAGLQLQAESRHLGRRSGRRILHGTVFGARNAGQTAGAGVNRQRYIRTGPSYDFRG